MRILVINGPNLNLLGQREPEHYGQETHHDLEVFLHDVAATMNMTLEIRQTNFEGIILDLLHYAHHESFDGIVLNAAALTHYAYALYDAIKAINIPVVEVHLTNPKARPEPWRHTSVIESACVETFSGEHFISYQRALNYFHALINETH